MGKINIYYLFVLSILFFSADPGLSQDSTSIDLGDFSLEELLNVEVVSISRKAENLQGAAAAIFVITAEDIRRSGAHSVPEVLRLAPGLNVARINANAWAITSRGFNSRFANKLQVLIDGRSIYSPMFSGVYWENSSVMLEDIERIEIIRGPGATMWGANAVNGVINIITAKPEPEEPDSFLTAMAGSEILVRGAGRMDGKAGDNGAWRLSTQAKRNDSTIMESGDDSHDAWDEFLARARWDHELGDRDNLTVTGHYFRGDLEHQYLNNTPDTPYSQIESGNIHFQTASFQTIWARDFSPTSGLKLALHFTYFDRDEVLLGETHNIVDLDFQHHFNAGRSHALIWGGAWRQYHDKMRGTPTISFNPDSVDGQVFSTFVQDDWTIVSDRLHLILGGKWEHWDGTGDQWQPSAQVAWTPSAKSTWWGSAARAIRAPNRVNRHVHMDMAMLPPGAMYPGSPTTAISMIGSREMAPEELGAYETGFRFKPAGNLSLDFALFINQYDELRILEMGAMTPHPIHGPPTMMIPMVVGNGPGGRTQGGELAANWKASKKCHFQLAYSYWDFKAADVDSGQSTGMERMATPKHQVSLRGIFNPSPDWESDIWFRFTDALMADPEDIGDWSELDLRLSWSPVPRLRLTAGGRNLLHDSHQEFNYLSSAPNPAWIQRSGYLEFRWSF